MTLAHKRVAQIAVAMANEIYEELAPRNQFYAAFPDRREFLNQCAPTLIHEARSALAKMLSDPGISDHDKEEIFEALELDRAIPDAENRSVTTLPGLPH